MGRITVLENKIAELIAAGEVVERPLSVVKELAENSVDAKATHMTVEIRGGGVEYIRVTDDGCGIPAGDVPLAFLRHATSKIQSADDLYDIRSLGFRGEALASIAAVSKVEVFTREADADTGTRILIEGGEVLEMDKAGCAPGTTFVMRSLFYNTPARMKFLKKSSSEAAAVGSLLDRLALCWPQVSLRYICDGKETLFTPGDNTLMGAVYAVYGRETADTLLEVDYALEGVNVKGYISKPLAARGSRKAQHFFLNNRLISSALLTAALEEGYKNSLMTGKFPLCALHITLHPSLTDVNVHPAKAQVKFADDRKIFDAVYWAVRNALKDDSGKAEPSSLARHEPKACQASEAGGLQMPLRVPQAEEKPHMIDILPQDGRQGGVALQNGLVYSPQSESPDMLASPAFTEPVYANIRAKPHEDTHPAPAVPEHSAKGDVPAAGAFDESSAGTDEGGESGILEQPVQYSVRLLGEVFDTYYIAQQGDEVLLIDKHAAHERLLFEELKRTRRSDAQILLSPVTFRLDKTELSVLLDHAGHLSAYGFLIEEFGPGTAVVREVPAFLFGADIPAVIEEIAAALGGAKGRISPDCEDEILHRMACRAAIKAGTPSSPTEQRALIERLLVEPDIKYCPHGRPVIVALTRQWLDKQFRRIP